MSTNKIDEISEKLYKLPEEKLMLVYEFVSFLLEKEIKQSDNEKDFPMLATEEILRRDWERTEEDEAWQNL